MDRSPYYHLERIVAPLLILAAENDPRCPPTQVWETVERLRARGAEAEAVVYPDEGHSVTGYEHGRDYDRRTVEFLLRHLDA